VPNTVIFPVGLPEFVDLPNHNKLILIKIEKYHKSSQHLPNASNKAKWCDSDAAPDAKDNCS